MGCVFILFSLGFVAVANSKSIAAQEENDDFFFLRPGWRHDHRVAAQEENDDSSSWPMELGMVLGDENENDHIVLGGNGHGIPPSWLRQGIPHRIHGDDGCRSKHGRYYCTPPEWRRKGDYDAAAYHGDKSDDYHGDKSSDYRPPLRLGYGGAGIRRGIMF